jgi:hypothetical protein
MFSSSTHAVQQLKVWSKTHGVYGVEGGASMEWCVWWVFGEFLSSVAWNGFCNGVYH